MRTPPTGSGTSSRAGRSAALRYETADGREALCRASRPSAVSCRRAVQPSSRRAVELPGCRAVELSCLRADVLPSCGGAVQEAGGGPAGGVVPPVSVPSSFLCASRSMACLALPVPDWIRSLYLPLVRWSTVLAALSRPCWILSPCCCARSETLPLAGPSLSFIRSRKLMVHLPRGSYVRAPSPVPVPAASEDCCLGISTLSTLGPLSEPSVLWALFVPSASPVSAAVGSLASGASDDPFPAAASVPVPAASSCFGSAAASPV